MSRFLWTQRANYGPSPRYRTSLAYDSTRGRAVLFGGNSLGAGQHGDTWEWDGSYWTQVEDIGPQARLLAGLAYDSAHQASILFGGLTPSGGLGDTWQWDGTNWTQLSDSGPGARSGHAMAYDSSRSRTVLFGGINPKPSTLSDTWEFDGQDWTQQQDSGPPARSGHSMAYDSVGKRVILFGGYDGTNPLGDTWSWDGQEWVQIAEFGPSARYEAAMASSGGNLILYGGTMPPAGTTPERTLSDTWEFDGKLWTQRQDIGPGPLTGAATTYDSSRERIVIFGGMASDTGALSGLTWEAPVTSSAQVAVAAVVVPPNIKPETPVVITITLTSPAPQGGAIVTFAGPIFQPNGMLLAPVTISAGLTSMDVDVAFAGAPGSTVVVTAQIAGTTAVAVSVPLESA